MKIKSILISSFIFIFLGCDQEDPCLNVNPDYLIIGEKGLCYLHYKMYDPPIIIRFGSNGEIVKSEYDLLNDESPDFVLKSIGEEWGPNNKRSRIESINQDFEILVNSILDSTFICTNPENEFNTQLPIHYNALSGYQCGKTDADSLEGVYPFNAAIQYNLKDTIWINEAHNTWGDNADFALYMQGQVELYGKEWFVYYRKELWNNQGTKYLCFRFNLGNEIKYGWLKIEIFDYSEIKYYGYAIQK